MTITLTITGAVALVALVKVLGDVAGDVQEWTAYGAVGSLFLLLMGQILKLVGLGDGKVDRLERRVMQLTNELIRHGIEVPPNPGDDK